jgi:hypothetical protein
MFIASSFSAVGSRRNNIWLVDSCFWISRQLNGWSRRLELDKIQKNKLTMPVLWFRKKKTRIYVKFDCISKINLDATWFNNYKMKWLYPCSIQAFLFVYNVVLWLV